MAIRIYFKRSNTTTSAPTTGDINEGEIALNLADGAIFSRDNSTNIVRFGVIEGTSPTTSRIPRYNGTAWVQSTAATLDASDNLNLGSGTITTSGVITGVGSGLTSVDAATLDGSAKSAFVLDNTAGTYNIGGVLYRESTLVHTGFKWMRVLDQTTYDGLTPDANTLYFITE